MKPSIVIAGSLAQKPGRGGHTWVFLQYLLGFKKLGWDVLFLDRLEPDMCVKETGARAPVQDSWNLSYFVDVMSRFDLHGSYALLCNGSNGSTQTIGMSRAEILARVKASAALINVMGFLADDEILAAAPTRVFLDIDPGFGQMWQALGQHDAFRGHDAFVTIAENIGRPDCAIPTCGLDWITTRQPIVMDHWPEAIGPRPSDAAITSVATWRGAYGPIDHQGTTYRLRAHEFRKFAALPRMAAGASRFELALDIHPADATDIDLLSGHGWLLIEPRSVAGDPWCYRDYVRQSAAELMIAKGMYVQTRSGWFSDRSICYLASGRPVLAQDTGLRDLLPTGDGLLTFTSLEDAADATRAIDRDYRHHARAARRLAEAYFDSSFVLGTLTRKLNLS
jgi:hypothetical protein